VRRERKKRDIPQPCECVLMKKLYKKNLCKATVFSLNPTILSKTPFGLERLNSNLFSVVLKVSHPFGPVFRLYTAGPGPGACCLERTMPLKCPHLLNSHLSDRPIHKKVICIPLMSVEAEALYSNVNPWYI
jgi:hypothetical protein